MGDMADMALDQLFDPQYPYDDYDEEPYDGFSNVMWDDETESWVGHGHKQTIKCRNCGETNLFWDHHPNGSWWLKNSKDAWHVCIKRGTFEQKEKGA